MSDFEEERQAIQLLTSKYVDKLTIIWKQIFHPDICKENLRKLIDHVTHFYQELVEETLSRKTFIENEINGLKKEADDLKRMLNTDVKLPSYINSELPLLIVQSELDKSLESLREQLKLRKEQIRELLLEQKNLCDELEEMPRTLEVDPLPSDQEIENFQKHLEALKNQKLERIHLIFTMRKEIKHFLQLLELKVSTEHEDRLLNQHEIKLNKGTIEALKRMHDLYGSQVKELRENIQHMRKKLFNLWDRLQTSPNTRDNFNRYNECNQHTYDVLRSELQRCETLKSLNIKHFVQQVRDDIAKMWEKTLKSELQRSRFSSFNSTCYTDDLLMLHEMELEDLNTYYETNKQIFELYADRNILWDRMHALEAKASDPARYNNRGGQLLKEEKERKLITTKLPKIEQKICELVKEYEEREHAPFLVYGENIIEVMRAQWDQRQHKKELLQSARKNASTKPTATKKNSTMRKPLTLTSVSCQQAVPSANSLRSNGTPVQKPNYNPNDLRKPIVKCTLTSGWNSPKVFQKASTSKTNIQHSKNNKNSYKSSLNLKSPLKKSKLIATTIRHRNGRYSGSIRKRRSITKTPAKVIPKIVVQCCHSDGYYTDGDSDESYDSFQKCIEPAARSSIIPHVSHTSITSGTKRMTEIPDDEIHKLAKLPRPLVINNNTSKNNTNSLICPSTPNKNISPVPCTTGRKLNTKNLPIII